MQYTYYIFKIMFNTKLKWHAEHMRSHLDEFYNLYLTRPITDNTGGMKSPHAFSTWYIIKTLQPLCIVESGVYKGLGTWLMEQACPTAKLVCIEPNASNLVYKSKKALYRTTDFLDTDWSNLPKNDTVLFFDDHQDTLERIKYAHSFGFKKIIIEDNYPPQQGDCYSPKKILSNKKFVLDRDGVKSWFDPILEDYEYLSNTLEVYQELPAVFKADKTRWGDLWNFEYETVTPLLNESDKNLYPEFYNERYDYTWLCYLELK